MNFRRQSALATGMLAFACAAFAQLSALEGDVRDADGKPVIGAMVKIARLDVARTYPVKTDKKGHYFYGSLPLGFYMISVQVDGRDVAAVTGIKSQPGDPIVISFNLGDTAEQHAKKAIEAIRRVGGEWSFVKPVPLAEPAKPQAADTASPVAGPKDTSDKDAAVRTAMVKQNAELKDAFQSGVAALEAKRYDEAIEWLTKASQIDPRQEMIWANLGSAYAGLASARSGGESQSALQKALDSYSKAVELNPNDAAIRYRYAAALAKAGKLAEMKAEIKKSADLDPPNAYRAYYNLGAFLINAGQTDAATEAFKMAIDAAPEEPQNAESYYQYGIGLMAKAKVGESGRVVPAAGTAEAFQKYLKLAPNGPFSQSCRDLLSSLAAGGKE